MYTFLKLIFNNSYSMSKIGKELTRGIVVNSKKSFFKVYESNITPFIRYIHNRKVEACGWVKLKPFTYTINEPKTTTSMIDVSIDEKDLIFEQKSGIAPIIVASFDIECSSSHGDFPLAKKSYKKLAFELYDVYHKR